MPPMPSSAPVPRQHTLSSLGWTPVGHAPYRSSVELVTDGSWLVSRVWSTDGVLDGQGLGPETVRAIVGVDGIGQAHVEGADLELRPRDLLLLRGDTRVHTENAGVWARCEWHLRSPALQHRKFHPHFARPVRLREDDYTLLTAMTNVISTREGFGSSTGASTLHGALSQVVLAGMLSAADETAALSPSQATILREAKAEIEARYADSDFDVASLAASLHISERYLRRVHALTGTTPRLAIEARRLDDADAVLAAAPTRSRSTFEMAALRSGFRSVRHLQEARQRRNRAGGSR